MKTECGDIKPEMSMYQIVDYEYIIQFHSSKDGKQIECTLLVTDQCPKTLALLNSLMKKYVPSADEMIYIG